MLTQPLRRFAAVTALSAQIFATAATSAGDLDLFLGWGHKSPRTPMMEVAATVDRLEKEIDQYGSVIVKQPDVWGEARWTKHRQEYEKEMEKQREGFKFTLQANQSTSDSAFLINAMAIGNALGGAAGTPGDVGLTQIFGSGGVPAFGPVPVPPAPVVGVPVTTTTLEPGISVEPTEFLNQMSTYLGHLHKLRRINEGDDTADAAGYALNLIRVPVSVLPGTKTRTGYGAEVSLTITPELTPNLLPDTFKTLVVNDLVDQLGLPVLKLAEMRPWIRKANSESMAKALKKQANEFDEAEDVLAKLDEADHKNDAEEHAKLLKLAVKKAIQLIGKDRFTVTPSVLPSVYEDIIAERENAWEQVLSQYNTYGATASLDKALELLDKTPESLFVVFKKGERWFDKEGRFDLSKFLTSVDDKTFKEGVELLRSYSASPVGAASFAYDVFLLGNLLDKYHSAYLKAKQKETQAKSAGVIEDRFRPAFLAASIAMRSGAATNLVADEKIGDTDQVTVEEADTGNQAPLTAPRDRRGRYAVAPTEITCVFGKNELVGVARDLDRIRISQGNLRLHLPDVQGFISEELEAAYRLLSSPEASSIWVTYCPSITRSVSKLEYCPVEHCGIDKLRSQFLSDPAIKRVPCQDGCDGGTICALAWAILVESAMLNDRLVEDMLRVQKATGTIFCPECPPLFVGPCPCDEACQIFNEYVRARWPVHVFAIDPTAETQNVSDAFARRRETQLALALAFTQGEMSARNFTRYARRVDYELETIALNKTVVGFSHGNDTFGWRFYPRVQAPPIEGNLKVGFRDLLIGPPGRDADLSKRQLEPGPRELMAVVIMPSFVPAARVDMRSNWFELTNPKKKKLTTEDSVRMGQMVQFIRNCKTQCMNEDMMTRPGDSARLIRAVDQLEKRLPLQEAMVQIPYENADGGFQLFSEGTRNLGPELIGFYGAPGLDAKTGGKLFLVGRNFNVNVTQVVIGGQECTYELLSREVMKVTVPKDLRTVEVTEFVNDEGKRKEKKEERFEARVATPYGVSGHVYIPVATVPDAPPPYKFDPAEAKACLMADNCVVTGMLMPRPVKVGGAAENDAVAIGLTAVLSDAREIVLKVPNLEPGKDPVKDALTEFGFKLDKTLTISQTHLSKFFTGGLQGGIEPLFLLDRPVAFKLTAKVKGKNDSGAVAIKDACLIRVAPAGSMEGLPASACNCLGAAEPGADPVAEPPCICPRPPAAAPVYGPPAGTSGGVAVPPPANLPGRPRGMSPAGPLSAPADPMDSGDLPPSPMEPRENVPGEVPPVNAEPAKSAVRLFEDLSLPRLPSADGDQDVVPGDRRLLQRMPGTQSRPGRFPRSMVSQATYLSY